MKTITEIRGPRIRSSAISKSNFERLAANAWIPRNTTGYFAQIIYAKMFEGESFVVWAKLERIDQTVFKTYVSSLRDFRLLHYQGPGLLNMELPRIPVHNPFKPKEEQCKTTT